jgi:hypothetical protein
MNSSKARLRTLCISGLLTVLCAVAPRTQAFIDPDRSDTNCETDSCVVVVGSPPLGDPGLSGGGAIGGGEGGGSGEAGAGGSSETVEVAAIGISVDSIDDLQCITDQGARQLNKDPASLRAVGRVTSQSSPEDR